jgi:PIN domain nuclease of toxin-antitoxin system
VNLLLDTHVLIWWDEGRRLAAEARRAIEEADAVFVSAASRDPFDRLLVAQAEVERLIVVTRDAVFGRYQVPVIRA